MKWEYRILEGQKVLDAKILAELGNAGWELVTAVTLTHFRGTTALYFKRALA